MQKKQNRIETSCLIFSPIRVVWRPRRHEVHLTGADHPQSILRSLVANSSKTSRVTGRHLGCQNKSRALLAIVRRDGRSSRRIS